MRGSLLMSHGSERVSMNFVEDLHKIRTFIKLISSEDVFIKMGKS